MISKNMENPINNGSELDVFLINDKADEVVENIVSYISYYRQLLIKLLQLLLSRYQSWLETSMKYNDFIFDCVHSLYYKYHEINANSCGPYINSPYWIKKATKIPVNKNDNKIH